MATKDATPSILVTATTAFLDDAQVEFGDDSIYGGNGNDTIQAWGGDDTRSGGAGSDQFQFAGSINSVLIADYVVGADRLVFEQMHWVSVMTQAKLDEISTTEATDLVLTFENGDTLTLAGLGSNQGLLADIFLL